MTGKGRTTRHPARRFRRLLSLYPPFLLQGIRVRKMAEDLTFCEVQVHRWLLTRNLAGTTFGGAIFAAADPIYAVMLWQHFAHRGRKVEVWLRSAKVRYRKPAATTLTLRFRLTPEALERAEAALERDGRFVEAFAVEARDRDGALCAELETEVYVGLPG